MNENPTPTGVQPDNGLRKWVTPTVEQVDFSATENTSNPFGGGDAGMYVS